MSIELEGMDELNGLLDGLTKTIRSDSMAKTLYPIIEQQLQVVIDESLSTQTSATSGQKYAPLSLATQQRSGKPARPALYSRSLGNNTKVSTVLGGGADGNFIVKGIKYPEIHQFGNPNNIMEGASAPIPARPFLPLLSNGQFTKKFQDELSTIINTWFNEQLNKNI